MTLDQLLFRSIAEEIHKRNMYHALEEESLNLGKSPSFAVATFLDLQTCLKFTLTLEVVLTHRT